MINKQIPDSGPETRNLKLETIIVAGVDIGSTTSKAVILEGRRIVGTFIGQSSTNPTKTADEVFQKALEMARAERSQVRHIVGTGYGRAKVAFANENVSELSCHGKGAHFLVPSVRTVIDIGGQDTKVISVDVLGRLQDFGVNDKCAAGTGRFLDFISGSLGLKVSDLGHYHFDPGEPVTISQMCSVFAESEVINLINEGVPLASVVKGLHFSVASRINSIARRVGLAPEVVVTGGVAKNPGVMKCLEEKLEVKLQSLPGDFDPQLIGALGAAVIAAEKVNKSA
ncbi:MAG: acyl-CoA dehydratase activase [bacterium]|nr:acyl-CoA dehydratase activase [bacterium]